MPDFDFTVNLPGFTIAKTSGFNPIVHDLDCHHDPHCPHCGGYDLRKKDEVRRLLLRFMDCEYHCRGCGRYFRQRLDGIQPWQRSTEALKKHVYRQMKLIQRRAFGFRNFENYRRRVRALCA